VFASILSLIRERIHGGRYVVTLHAEEEMDDDGLNVYDLEYIVLTGQIVRRQRDLETGRWKYRVRGRTVDDAEAEVVVQVGPTGTIVFITVYTL